MLSDVNMKPIPSNTFLKSDVDVPTRENLYKTAVQYKDFVWTFYYSKSNATIKCHNM